MYKTTQVEKGKLGVNCSLYKVPVHLKYDLMNKSLNHIPLFRNTFIVSTKWDSPVKPLAQCLVDNKYSIKIAQIHNYAK